MTFDHPQESRFHSTISNPNRPVLAGYWVLTQLSSRLSTWVLITYLDDLIIIQVSYQSLSAKHVYDILKLHI